MHFSVPMTDGREAQRRAEESRQSLMACKNSTEEEKIVTDFWNGKIFFFFRCLRDTFSYENEVVFRTLVFVMQRKSKFDGDIPLDDSDFMFKQKNKICRAQLVPILTV